MSNNSGGFELDGMRELLSNIERLGKTINADLEDAAVKAGAEVAKAKIESHPNVPVSKLNKAHGKDHFAIKQVETGKYNVGVEDDFFYLLFHEIGAQSGTYKVGNKKYHTPDITAKPFLRPALEDNKEAIQAAMAAKLRQGLGL